MTSLDTETPAIKLNDGCSMPMLAYGSGTAWSKIGDESKVDKALIDATKMSLKLGFLHQDCAEVYKTESEIGTAIKESKIPREKLYITTKVHQSYQDIEGGIKGSLKKLGVEYLDLFLIHNPLSFKTEEDLQNAWKTMEKLKETGLTKSIGVSNFEPEHLDRIMKVARTPPAVNQIEFHPYRQQQPTIQANKDAKIVTQAYGPLTPITKGAPGPIDDYLAALAKKYAVSPGDVLLRWCIDQDVGAVTTSSKEERMNEYLRVASFKLNPKEIQDLARMGDKKHFRAFNAENFRIP